MATATIKVSTDKLRNTATNFLTEAHSIQNITKNMTETVNSLSGNVWSGDAATAYKKKFGELQDDINRMIKMINEHVDDLNRIATEFDAAEKEAAALSNKLAGDVIK